MSWWTPSHPADVKNSRRRGRSGPSMDKENKPRILLLKTRTEHDRGIGCKSVTKKLDAPETRAKENTWSGFGPVIGPRDLGGACSASGLGPLWGRPFYSRLSHKKSGGDLGWGWAPSLALGALVSCFWHCSDEAHILDKEANSEKYPSMEFDGRLKHPLTFQGGLKGKAPPAKRILVHYFIPSSTIMITSVGSIFTELMPNIRCLKKVLACGYNQLSFLRGF